MSKKSHVLHVLFIVATVVGALLVEALSPGGALAHFQWSAPALGLVVYFVRLLNGTGAAGPPAAAVVVAALMLLAPACAHMPGPVPPADGGTLTDCSDSALHTAEIELIPQVENALALADYSSVTAALSAILVDLTSTVGAPLALAEVTCVVDWVVSKAQLAHAQTSDALAGSQAAFGARWVQEHGANVKPVAVQ